MRLPGPKNPENWQNLHRVAKLGLGGGKNSPLINSKYLWLRNPLDFNPEQKEHFDTLRQSELKTARAWHLKQTSLTSGSCMLRGRQGSSLRVGTTGRCAPACDLWL